MSERYQPATNFLNFKGKLLALISSTIMHSFIYSCVMNYMGRIARQFFQLAKEHTTVRLEGTEKRTISNIIESYLSNTGTL